MKRFVHLMAVFVLLVTLAASPLATTAAPSTPPKPGGPSPLPQLDTTTKIKVEPQVLKELATQGTATFLVYMTAQANLQAAQSQSTVLSRRRAVVAALQQTAQRSQAPLLAYLNTQKANGHVKAVISYWIFNGLAVTGDAETLVALAQRPDVQRIQANHVHHIDSPAAATVSSSGSDTLANSPAASSDAAAPATTEWNVDKVRAPDVWSGLGITGQGVVVASIDTGVYLQHPALLRKFRGYNNGNIDSNYNWFDFTGTYPNAPNDGNGHGTHTMGTMVGSDASSTNQIGVAPGAQWMAVKAFDDGGNTTDAELHSSFQFIMAPTDLAGNNPDPSKAPNVVNNSWGSTDSTDQTFWDDVTALVAAGIVPFFAAGNNGTAGTGSVDSPGSFPQSFAVGATNINDVIASFSGRGPSPFGVLKPDVSAPGVNIRSSVPPSVDPSLYQGGWNGTSMATPHGTGVAALLLSARPDLTITATEFALTSTALPLPNGSTSQNNDYGWGRIDAFGAVSSVMNGGRFQGRVTDAVTGQGIAGADIVMLREDGSGGAQTTTDGQGYYTFTVGAGLYQVTASDFWHTPLTKFDVQIVAGFTTALDFALTLKPSGVLRGQVTSGGLPITATIVIAGVPMSVATDAGGVYSVTLPAAIYSSMRVKPATGYREATATNVGVYVGAVTVLNFDLPVAPRILLVDGDAWSLGASKITYWQNDLDSLLYSFDTWQVMTFTTGVPPTTTLRSYNIVLWDQTTTSPGYVGAWPSLADYLNAGGHLLLSGQDIGFQDDKGATQAYYRNYLHARLVNDDSGFPGLSGVPGEIFTGITMTLNTADSAGNQTSPDAIAPLDASATPLFSYTTGITNGGAAGLKIDTGTYQAIYLPFGLEGSGPSTSRQQTLQQALSWLSFPALLKSADASQVSPAQDVTFTLRLANTTVQAVSGLTISDPLPSSLTYAPGSATGGLVYDQASRTLSWRGSILGRSIMTFTFHAQVAVLPGGAAVSNTAYLAAAPGISLPTTANLLTVAPDLSTSLKSVSPSTAASGQNLTYTVQISNTGTADGLVSVVDPIPAGTTYVDGSATGAATFNAALNRIEWSDVISAADPLAGQFSFTTSDDAGGPSFSWVDISAGGTDVHAGDDTTHGPFDIGFPFTYFGKTYTQFWISSNGWMTFVSPANSAFTNYPLPSASAPPAILAGFWDDLNPGSGGHVYYQSGADSLVVAYVNTPHYSSGGPYTFEMILRSDGSITYQYLDMQSTRLNEATIGLQDDTMTRGITVIYNESFVHNNLSILFTPHAFVSSTRSFGFQARVNDGLPLSTVITNTATASTADGLTYMLNATATANVMDLSTATKTVDKLIAGFGDSLTYAITISNTGNAGGTVYLTDTLPAVVSYLPGSASAGATYDAASRSIFWNGTVAAAAAPVVNFAVALSPNLVDNQLITNTATLVDQGGRSYQTSAVTQYRTADLSASHKDVTPTIATAGDVVTFTLTVANGGSGATGFMLTDTLPAQLSYVAGSLQVGHGTASYNALTRQLIWSGDLPGQYQSYLRFAAQVTSPGTITNTAQIRDFSGHVIERSATVSASGPSLPNRMIFPFIIKNQELP